MKSKNKCLLIREENLSLVASVNSRWRSRTLTTHCLPTSTFNSIKGSAVFIMASAKLEAGASAFSCTFL
jgi:hypothetical protein